MGKSQSGANGEFSGAESQDQPVPWHETDFFGVSEICFGDWESFRRIEKKTNSFWEIEGGVLQARANLNGGELDKEPFLRDKRGQKTMTWM